MNSGHILVVALDDDLRRSVTFALSAYGYAVTAARNWADIFQGGEFDCLVVDEPALADKATPYLQGHKPVLLLAYSAAALANAAVTGVIAMPLTGEAVIQAVAAATAPAGASTK